MLNVIICAAENGDPVTSNCAGPFPQAFVGVANQLREVDITAIVAPRVGADGSSDTALGADAGESPGLDQRLGA